MSAVFPTTVPTAAQLRTLVNNCSTLLGADITAIVATIPVDDTTLFPTAGEFTIGTEIVTYTGKTSNSFTGCTRGAYSSPAAVHSENDLVSLFYIAYHHNQMRDELIAIAQNISDRFGLGASAIVVPSTVSFTLAATSNQLILGTTRTITITAPTPASSSRTHTIPDVSGDADFVMSLGAQSVAGAKTLTDNLTISKASPVLYLTGSTTTFATLVLKNATASIGVYLGLENAAGGQLVTGTSAYSAVFGHCDNYALHLATNNTIRMTIAAAGETSLIAGTADDTVYGNLLLIAGGNTGHTELSQYTATGITTAKKIMSTDSFNFVLVVGTDGTNSFLDILTCGFLASTPVVVASTTIRGTPAARTYSMPGNGNLSLAMASGTYTSHCTAFGMNNR
jgi:hypothetical protein